MSAKDNIGIGIIVLIIALFFFFMASYSASQQGAVCDNHAMQPGDICQHFVNGHYEGDTTYDQQLQAQHSDTTKSVGIGIVLSIVGIGFFLYGLLSKPSKPTPKPPVSAPPPIRANKRPQNTSTTQSKR